MAGLRQFHRLMVFSSIALLTITHLLSTPAHAQTPPHEYAVQETIVRFLPRSINKSGQISGMALVPLSGNHSTSAAALFSRGPDGTYLQSGGLNAPHLLAGTTLANGASINDLGQIAGWGSGLSSGFIWTPSTPNAITGSYTPFPAQLNAINNDGVAVGYSFDGNNHAFCVGCPFQFSTLGGVQSWAWGINNHGQVIGQAEGPFDPMYGSSPFAVLYDQNGAALNLTPESTPFGEGLFSIAFGSNEQGQIVGYYDTALWSGDYRAFVYDNGVLNDIDPGNTFGSFANAINNYGTIVGSFITPSFQETAAVYSPETPQFRDLQGLIDTDSVAAGIQVNGASDINDCGQIAAQGTLGGLDIGMLISPVFTARVFDPDPLSASGDDSLHGLPYTDLAQSREILINSQRSCLQLQGLQVQDNSSGCLKGQYAEEVRVNPSHDSELTCTPTFVYDYPRTENGFAAANIYFHTDQVARYVHELGFFDLRNTPLWFRTATTDPIFGDSVAGYHFATGQLFFSPNFRAAAEDPMAIWHENAHRIIQELAPGFGTSQSLIQPEQLAIGEGFADFFAASRFKGLGPSGYEDATDGLHGVWTAATICADPEDQRCCRDSSQGCITSWPSTTPPSLRNLNNQKMYPNDFLEDGDYHRHSEIWSGALWDIQNIPGVGRDRVNRLMIEVFKLTEVIGFDFPMFAHRFLERNEFFYQAEDNAAIRDVFLDRGILLDIDSLTFDNENPNAGDTVTATITLSGQSRRDGYRIQINSSESAVAAVPTLIEFPDREISETFEIAIGTATADTSVDITVTILDNVGTSPVTATLDVSAPSIELSLNSQEVKGGSSLSGSVTLPEPAPAGGAVISLTSSSSSATVPASVTIPAGQSSATFNISTTSVASPTEITINATYGSVAVGQPLLITPPEVTGLTLFPGVILGGLPAFGFVELDAPAPTGGATVALQSGHPAVIVPGQVNVSAGLTFGVFLIQTTFTASTVDATITATYNAETTATLRVLSLWLF